MQFISGKSQFNRFHSPPVSPLVKSPPSTPTSPSWRSSPTSSKPQSPFSKFKQLEDNILSSSCPGNGSRYKLFLEITSSLFIELLIKTILSVSFIFHNLSKNIKLYFFSLKSVAKVEMICHKQILSAIATNLLFISSNTICVSKTLNMICKSLFMKN